MRIIFSNTHFSITVVRKSMEFLVNGRLLMNLEKLFKHMVGRQRQEAVMGNRQEAVMDLGI